MDVKKMLERVNMVDEDPLPTLETLKDVCMGFASNIPFDTLDMFGGKKKVWDLALIYEDIVIKKRGGFCYELNIMLHWVLQELGFKVDLLKGYYQSEDKPFERSDHMTLMVTFENGEKWLTDVGWGGSGFVYPLRMKQGCEQEQPSGVYRIGKKGQFFIVEKKKQVCLKNEGDRVKFNNEDEKSIATTIDGEFLAEWNTLFGFKDSPCKFADFQEGHDHAQYESQFLTSNAVAVLQNERGRRFFFNNLFTVKEYTSPGVITVVEFKNYSVNEMYEVLEKQFGIKIDFKLKLKSVQ